MSRLLPVTLLSGFLGAGKTTLLEHILRTRTGLKVAVIVNDMAEVNIDASLVSGTRLLQSTEQMVELHNGCICCTLRVDLLLALRELALATNIDLVIVESTGISEPMQVAETFYMPPPDGSAPLCTVARLDNCVTVVDTSLFAEHFDSLRGVSDSVVTQDIPQDDERSIAHLLVDQIEFANIILLNKTDLVSEDELVRVETLCRSMNPTATIVRTHRSQADLDLIVLTSRFTQDFAERAKGWMLDVYSGKPHTPETEEYGISSFVYRSETPFHPQRIHDWIVAHFILQEIDVEEEEDDCTDASRLRREAMEREQYELMAAQAAARRGRRESAFGGILRSKGYAWIGTPQRLGGFGQWAQAGNMLTVNYGGGWGNFPLPKSGPGGRDSAGEKNPCQEIVFIGQRLQRAAIVESLNACLLTKPETDLLTSIMQLPDALEHHPFPDPFQLWIDEEADWEDVDEEEEVVAPPPPPPAPAPRAPAASAMDDAQQESGGKKKRLK